jgi:stringent starvation protein B
VLGIYARETGQGMIFGEDDEPGPAGPGGPAPKPPAPKPPEGGPGPRRGPLKVVK